MLIISMNQQNCCIFRLKENIKLLTIYNEVEEEHENKNRVEKEVTIIIELLKSGVDYNIKDNSNQN